MKKIEAEQQLVRWLTVIKKIQDSLFEIEPVEGKSDDFCEGWNACVKQTKKYFSRQDKETNHADKEETK